MQCLKGGGGAAIVASEPVHLLPLAASQNCVWPGQAGVLFFQAGGWGKEGLACYHVHLPSCLVLYFKMIKPRFLLDISYQSQDFARSRLLLIPEMFPDSSRVFWLSCLALNCLSDMRPLPACYDCTNCSRVLYGLLWTEAVSSKLRGWSNRTTPKRGKR